MRSLAILGLAAATAWAAPVSAQQIPSDTTQVHIVGPGDTLWDLARRYLNDPYLWPEIFSVNQGVVADPDLIFPRERLLIPGRAPVVAGAAGQPGPPAAQRPAESRTVFFSGQAPGTSPQARVVEAAALPDAPVVQPGAFYAAGILVRDGAILVLGHVQESIALTALPIDQDPQIQPYDRVFITVAPDVRVGDRLHLLRRERAVEYYGLVHIPTGIARVLEIENGVATAEIESMFDEVARGDLAVALPDFDPPLSPPVEWSGLEGEVLTFENQQPLVSREDIVFLNLGEASGVVEGDEFEIYSPAEVEDWGIRPATPVARVQTVRVEELTSAARVVSMEQPAIEEGMPVRLVAKMR